MGKPQRRSDVLVQLLNGPKQALNFTRRGLEHQLWVWSRDRTQRFGD
jgi:hypothetical protein